MMRAFGLERSWANVPGCLLPLPAITLLSCFATASAPAWAADAPASPQQAAALIDLSSFEPIRPVETDRKLQASIASQSYIASGSVTSLAKELQERLTRDGWRVLEGGMITEAYASLTLHKAGFTLSLSVTASGKPNEAHVVLSNHGNVDFKRLPLPGDLQPQYQTPVMTMLKSSSSVADTAAKIAQSLTAAGWHPYGAPAGSLHFKQNGVRLLVSIMAAPAQDGATIVQIMSEQMSADLPIPDGAEGIQYSDSTRQVTFDQAAPMATVFASLTTLLAREGWKPTTASPIKIDFREHLIFRNEAGEMIDVACHSVEEKTRCRMEFRSASEVEQSNRAAAAEVARRAAATAAQSAKTPISIARPAGAKLAESRGNSVEFSLPSGRAAAAATAWLAILEQQGWKPKTNVREAAAGDFELEKDGIRLHVTYLDPGFIPGTISVTALGAATLKVDQ